MVTIVLTAVLVNRRPSTTAFCGGIAEPLTHSISLHLADNISAFGRARSSLALTSLEELKVPAAFRCSVVIQVKR